MEFAIAGYKDKLLCDVLHMDSCHLLLGRPWKFDREVVYDGRANSITFKKGGKTFKIQSLLEVEETQAKVASVLFCSGKEFVKDLKDEECQSFVVVMKSKEKEIVSKEPLPVEVQTFLKSKRT